jgi:hypothetical protein
MTTAPAAQPGPRHFFRYRNGRGRSGELFKEAANTEDALRLFRPHLGKPANINNLDIWDDRVRRYVPVA